MRAVYLLMLLGLFFSCKKANHPSVIKIKGVNRSSSATIVSLRPEDACKRMKLSELIDTSTLTVIPLETTSESVFGGMVFKVFDGRIYIEDRRRGAILAFSETGKYLGKVDALGRGPEEYGALNDFIVQGDSIMVQDYAKILYYHRDSFKYLKVVPLGMEGIVAVALAADDSSYYFLQSEVSTIKSSLVICDKRFKVQAALRDPSYGDFSTRAVPAFFPMMGKMYYHSSYNDTIYRPTVDGLVPELIWDCGDRALTLKQYKSIPVRSNSHYPIREVPKKYFYGFAFYTCADSILTFSASHDGRTYKVYYSLATGHVRMMSLAAQEDDLFHINLKVSSTMAEDDYFYALIYPGAFSPGKKRLTEGLLAGWEEDDNPVVLKFKYRKF